jgi:hypothetical protein
MLRVGLEPKIPIFERVKTIHALDCAATVIGTFLLTYVKLVTFHGLLVFSLVVNKLRFYFHIVVELCTFRLSVLFQENDVWY